MKKKTLVIILTIALLLPLLTATAFAADLTNEDVVDAQGGFFRDLGKKIVDGFNNSIDGVKSGINAISDGIGKIIASISGAVKNIVDSIIRAVNSFLKGLYDLFVPSDNYFIDVQIKLSNAINKKIGGILSLTKRPLF